MDKLRLGIFDIFGLLLPGFLALTAILLPVFFNSPVFVKAIFESKEQGIILLMLTIAAFITGMTIHQAGYWWYCNMGLKLGRRFKTWSKRKKINAEWELLKKADPGAKKSDTETMKELANWYDLYTNNSRIGDYAILIRQFTPEQQGYLDEWTSKRALCFNLSLGFLLLTISTSLLILADQRADSLWVLIIISPVASVVLIKRARVFDKWWRLESKKIISQFKLEQIEFKEFKAKK